MARTPEYQKYIDDMIAWLVEREGEDSRDLVMKYFTPTFDNDEAEQEFLDTRKLGFSYDFLFEAMKRIMVECPEDLPDREKTSFVKSVFATLEKERGGKQ